MRFETRADAADCFVVFNFVVDDLADLIGELFELLGLQIAHVRLAVALGVGPFEEPGGRAPVPACGLPKRVERGELGG